MAVIFGEDALSDKTLVRIFSYIEKAGAEFVWSTNLLIWPPNLIASTGAVLTHILPEQIADTLFSEILERGKIPYRPRLARGDDHRAPRRRVFLSRHSSDKP